MKRVQTLVKATVAFIFAASLFYFGQPAFASGNAILPTPTGKCPEDYATAGKKSTGSCQDGSRDYSLDDIKTLLGNVGNWMLGVSGAIALFVFVLGGFFWLASAGSSSMVEKGKGMMISGIIGLAIIFFSFTLITYGVRILAGSGADEYLPKAQGPGANPDAPTIYSVASFPPEIAKSTLCTTKLNGACTPKGKCSSGTPIAGACSGSNDCCVQIKYGDQKSQCDQLGGVCQKKSVSCGGAYIKNLCLGGGANADVNTQCCLGN